MKNIVKIERNASVYFRLGEKKRDEGQMHEAVYYFFCCTQYDDCIDALVELGKTYAQMGCHHEGLKYLFFALDKAPQNNLIRQSIGEIYSQLDDDETAIFYIAPAMTIRRFNRIMEQESFFDPPPPIRVLEKNDEITLNIAVKLFESGDNKYAVQILDAIKPSSEQFVIASNMLTLYEIEQGNFEKAKKHLDQSLSKKDTVLGRCSQLLLYNKIIDNKSPVFNDLRKTKKEDIIRKIENFNLTLSERKSVTLSLIRANEPQYAIEHLKRLCRSDNYDKDSMVCYALCLYACGHTEQARQQIFKAHYTFPSDLPIKHFLQQITLGKNDIGLGPKPSEQTEKEWLNQINELLELATVNEKEFLNTSITQEVKEKLEWLFQSEYIMVLSKASLVLARIKTFLPMLKRFLLLDGINMRTKKIILFSILLNGVNSSFIQPECQYPLNKELSEKIQNDYFDIFDEDLLMELNEPDDEPPSFSKQQEFDSGTYTEKGRLGILLDGLYVRLRIVYPNDLDDLFLAGYCLAYSSFAICDSCFEDRLLGASLRALKKYNCAGFDKSAIHSEEALAGALFYATRHSDINNTRQCAMLFGISEEIIIETLQILSLRRTRTSKAKKDKN